MEYYGILNFKKEPFSNSPEPEFLFSSPQHTGCLQKLELSVRLRRGLNVVIGDVGTGKTTLCRKLIQNFSATDAQPTEIETHLLLDPSFNSPVEFLQTVCAMIGIEGAREEQSEWHLKEKIKNYLFVKGVDEDKIVVLVIDEGQKISADCLEILREFLNYETNDFKLLQIIIFAQKEFKYILNNRPNLTDRINVLYYLKPLNFKQMQAMIKYRLAVARNFEIAPPIFSSLGYAAIYLATGGYPRKVVSLCHEVILKMIIRNKHKAGWFFVRSCVNDMAAPLFKRIKWAALSLLLFLALIFPVKAIISDYKTTPAEDKISPAPVIAEAPNTAPAEETPQAVTKSESIAIAAVVEQKEPQENKMPLSLGLMTVKKGMTLWWIIYDIYGSAGHEILDAVIRENPHIKNKNIIEEGYTLMLPSIPAKLDSSKTGKFVLLLKDGENIEEIYDFFNKNRYRKDLPSMIFLPYWEKTNNSVRYAVIVNKNYDSAQDAGDLVKKLPQELAGGVKIISNWNNDTIFFNRRALQG
jgi:general secretion pathway protein A